jgi:hypothetical protein
MTGEQPFFVVRELALAQAKSLPGSYLAREPDEIDLPD